MGKGWLVDSCRATDQEDDMLSNREWQGAVDRFYAKLAWSEKVVMVHQSSSEVMCSQEPTAIDLGLDHSFNSP